MEIISVVLSLPKFVRELGDLPSAWRYQPHPADIEVLKKLWRYINSVNVTELVEGVLNDALDLEIVGHLGDDYLEIRRYPEYQLYDRRLEQKLEKFDASLAELFSYTGELFAPFPPSPKLRIIHKMLAKRHPVGIGSPDFRIQRQQHQKMNKVAMRVYEDYQEFIRLLRRRRLIHEIARQSEGS